MRDGIDPRGEKAVGTAHDRILLMQDGRHAQQCRGEAPAARVG